MREEGQGGHEVPLIACIVCWQHEHGTRRDKYWLAAITDNGLRPLWRVDFQTYVDEHKHDQESLAKT